MTNAHVVQDADEILVRLNDRRELSAELIGSDTQTDVALLKIDANNLPVLNLGDSDELKVGEWVAAIGSPFGFDHSVTAGIVSAINRTLPRDAYVPFIQTDVAINPGNSGGPLFNLQGRSWVLTRRSLPAAVALWGFRSLFRLTLLWMSPISFVKMATLIVVGWVS